MSGLIGLSRPRGEYKSGDVIQVKSCHINTDISTNTSQQVIFGCHSSNNLMQINPGNRVHVHVHFQAYTGANAGGYAWVSRGLGRGNSSSNTVRGDWYSHGDNLNSVCGDGGTMDPHIYTTTASHTYFHFSMNFLDPNPDWYDSTNIRYSLALGCHSGAGSSVTIAGTWSEVVTWTLTEIQE